MQVKNFMTSNVETINAQANLVEAARRMKLLEIGSLPVWDGEQIIGMVTDRDIIERAIAEDLSSLSTYVSEIMTPEVCSCYEDDDITEAAQMMERNQIHRLLVLNSSNVPVGIVTLADVAVKTHDEHMTWEVMERICEPACPHR